MNILPTLLLIAAALRPTTAAVPGSIGMPRAHSDSSIAETRGCIVITVFKAVEEMDEAERENFLRHYPADTLCTVEEGDRLTAFTAGQPEELAACIRNHRKALLADGVDERAIRLYLRISRDVRWSRASTVISCAADVGISNLVISATEGQ